MRKLVTLASLTFGCVLLGLAAANFFPDQTWSVLNMAQTFYDRIASRTTPTTPGADRQIRDSMDRPCYAHMSDEVEQISANPQAFAHRIVTIPGLYVRGFEISSLSSCGNGHILDLWVENALGVISEAKLNEQLPSRERWDVPILAFKFNKQKNAAAWRKLRSQGYCSDVSVVGQFETNTPKKGGFGHLGAYTHELILLDVLSTKKCEIRRS